MFGLLYLVRLSTAEAILFSVPGMYRYLVPFQRAGESSAHVAVEVSYDHKQPIAV